MPAVARQNDQFKTGHGCASTSTITGPSTNVFANGRGVERKGDPSVSHNINSGWRGRCQSHTVNIASGSTTVFVNGKPIARVGDQIDKGSISSGSDNVFAG